MRVIIQNDKARLYARIDNAFAARSRMNAESLVDALSIDIINAKDFVTNDYILIGNIDGERTEMKQINSITANTLVFTVGTSFAHEDKTDVYKIEYNQLKFYEDDTVITAAIDLHPDYYTSLSKVVDEAKTYSVSFFNSTTSQESPRGEKIYGSEYLLCGIGDIAQHESTDIIGGKIIDKIDLATRVIRAKFTNQKQVFADLSNREVLRLPTALLSLHLYFFELIKVKDDISSIKTKNYMDKYDTEMERATKLINTLESQVQVFGQAQCIR